MEEQKEFYEQRLNHLQDEVHAHSHEKEGLRSKMKKVYERTQERMPDEESRQGYLDLVNQVMQEQEAVGEDAEEGSALE